MKKIFVSVFFIVAGSMAFADNVNSPCLVEVNRAQSLLRYSETPTCSTVDALYGSVVAQFNTNQVSEICDPEIAGLLEQHSNDSARQANVLQRQVSVLSSLASRFSDGYARMKQNCGR